MSDSSRGRYHYRTTPLEFSPEALEKADGKIKPYFFESLESINPDTPVQLLAAYIPASKQASREMKQWILSKTSKKATSKTTQSLDSNDGKGDFNLDTYTCYTVSRFYTDGQLTTIIIQAHECVDVTPDPGGGDNDSGGDGGSDAPCDQQLVPGPDCSDDNDCPPPYYCGGGGDGGDGDQDQSDPCEISMDDLANIFPNSTSSVRNKLLDMIGKYGDKFEINSQEKIATFLGQTGHETGGFETLNVREDLYYTTASRLVEVWPTRFSQTDPNLADPDDYLRNEEKLANFVYSNRMGNGSPSSGDGWRYRGRGIMQLTGKNNYVAFTNNYQDLFNSTKDFEQNPGLIKSDKELSILSVMWYFKENVIDADIELDGTDETFKVVTEAIRNTTGSWSKRKNIYNKAKSIIDCEN